MQPRNENARAELGQAPLAPVIPFSIKEALVTPLPLLPTSAPVGQLLREDAYQRLAVAVPFFVIAGLLPNVLANCGVGQELSTRDEGDKPW